MRPILKSNGRVRSPGQSSTPSPSKRPTHFSPSGRRVTFSPFAKTRRRLQPKRLDIALEETGDVTSGFAFNAVMEREKRRQSRRKHKMGMFRSLYNAARTQPSGWRSIVDKHLAMLKIAHVRVSDWIRVIKHPFSRQAWRTRNRRVLRSHFRHAPQVFFDTTDRQYVQSVNAPLLAATCATSMANLNQSHQSSPLHASRCAGATAPSSTRGMEIYTPSTPVLTPIHHGSLSNLLRREGIPAVEDEWREHVAVEDDLRGVTHRSTGLQIVSQRHGLYVS